MNGIMNGSSTRTLLAGVLGLSLAACGRVSPAASTPKQLVENDFACPASPSRVAWAKTKFPNAFSGGDTTRQQQGYESLALLPREYLFWVLDRNGLVIELREEDGGSVRGATTSEGDGNEWHPTEMYVEPRQGNFDPLPHEMGHASEGYISKTFANYQDKLSALFAASAQGDEGQYMRDYARSDETEFFAELYNSYYCGTESRDDMKAHMPQTLAFAQEFLVDPAKLDEGTSGLNTLEGKSQGVDSDGDGVSNAFDLCAGTSASATVWHSRQYYGCAQGQTPAS